MDTIKIPQTAREPDLPTSQIVPVIRRLIAFIGQVPLRKTVTAWERSIKNSKGFISEHHKLKSFRWWSAFDEFWKVERVQGNFLSKNVETLAIDAMTILELLPGMPPSIQQKFKSALSSMDNAAPHLFEIMMARHFWKMGYRIEWCEETKKPVPDFIIKSHELEIEVECKRIAVDQGDPISDLDGARLLQAIHDRFHKLPAQGNVEILLNEKLSSNHQDILKLVADVTSVLKQGNAVEWAQFGWGNIKMNLTWKTDVPLGDTVAMALNAQALHRKRQIFIPRIRNGVSMQPLSFSLGTIQQNVALQTILKKLKEAAKLQLSSDRPALLCVYLSEVHDFKMIPHKSLLEKMTMEFFESENRRHVVAVDYTSDYKTIDLLNAKGYFTESLLIKNKNCCFRDALSFRFSNQTLPEPH